MKEYIIIDEWKIVEEGFNPKNNRISESIFSLGNGQMGQRANFEEEYTGDSLQGNYVGGVYYPDKTKVGWWKIGYPAYFAKVLNACDWSGLKISINGESLDLAKAKKINAFRRELDMKKGLLTRKFRATTHQDIEVTVQTQRACSMADNEIGFVKYSLQVKNFTGKVDLTSYLDFDVKNEDANYDEKFWLEVDKNCSKEEKFIVAETKKTGFHVCAAMENLLLVNNESITSDVTYRSAYNYIEEKHQISVKPGDEIIIIKVANISSSRNHAKADLSRHGLDKVKNGIALGFNALRQSHVKAWKDIWNLSDIIIKGDPAAQQAIRFNIFQLYQTYTGKDSRLNIGPKGFTGEKYGGSTYWDTEAYCLPFYLGTADPEVGKNLLIYRYRQLGKAIENAEKLGFSGGAALYPMVTMTGEECHNEWEITFEEIHRNGAIAYAIFDYIRYTGDENYLSSYGLEVLIAISRFWQQRVNWSKRKKKYVILGVTGPNEYENNVNNNWYTNYIARWCLDYTRESIDTVRKKSPERWQEIKNKTDFVENELNEWSDIIENIYLPEDEEYNVFAQQDNFFDKEIRNVDDLDESHRPINQNWSWDRILRSCFIKQADVLQGIYFFEDHFDMDTIRRNFLFYEQMTVHESSLSPCVHSIIAAKLGMREKAYDMYLRTSRLDLNDYNNDTEDGLHITSMAGTWMSVVKGFAGQRVIDGKLKIAPLLPDHWQKLAYTIKFRNTVFKIEISPTTISISHDANTDIDILIYEEEKVIPGHEDIIIPYRNK